MMIAAEELEMQPITLTLSDIADAPTQLGRFGPCLLADTERGWIIGRFDGAGWWDLDGSTRLQPLQWAFLPAISLNASH